MTNSLDKTQRTKLEGCILNARETAERAVSNALEYLGVGRPEAEAHLTDDLRVLRNRLRAHGRSL